MATFHSDVGFNIFTTYDMTLVPSGNFFVFLRTIKHTHTFLDDLRPLLQIRQPILPNPNLFSLYIELIAPDGQIALEPMRRMARSLGFLVVNLLSSPMRRMARSLGFLVNT